MPDPTAFANLLESALDTAMNERGTVNVLVAGGTGAGKSTLINGVFQGDFAETGQGRPVTKGLDEVSKDGVPLTVLDTRGIETAAFRETRGELVALLRERGRDPDPNRHVHVAWLCVSEGDRRFQDAESDVAALLAEHVPVIAVVTKAQQDMGSEGRLFSDDVRDFFGGHVRDVVRVRALSAVLDGGHRLPAMGLATLVRATMAVVPEGQRNALGAAQKVDLKAKQDRSHRVVLKAATAAAAVAAVPVPFADAAALVPIQVTMLARVSAAFGLPVNQAYLGTLAGAALVAGGGGVGGRLLFANFVRMVPGAGSVVGGAIAAVTAVGLTLGFGEAYVAALSGLFLRKDVGSITPDDVGDAFKREVRGLKESELRARAKGLLTRDERDAA